MPNRYPVKLVWILPRCGEQNKEGFLKSKILLGLGAGLMAWQLMACDVATDVQAIGWHLKKSTLLFQMAIKKFHDGPLGTEEQPVSITFYTLSLKNIQKLKEVQTYSGKDFEKQARKWRENQKKKGFHSYVARPFKNDGSTYTDNKTNQNFILRLENRNEVKNTGSYALYKIGKTQERKIADHLADSPLSATEGNFPWQLFFTGEWLVGIHKGCGTVSAWAIPRKKL
jgi:hypothetical protein